MAQSNPVLLVGATVEGFKVLRELGRGKHHSVMLAEDTRGGMQLALKIVVIPDGEQPLARVLEALADLKEFQAARHPSLLQVWDAGTVEGDETGHLGYLAMELCGDGTLADRIAREGALTAGAALKVLWQLAEATHALHEVGIIHGAITPGNVLVGAHGRCVLTEPAVHRMHRALHGWSAARKPESIIYRAPEDASDVNLNRRADVYSLGALLFFLLTGKHPPQVTAGGKGSIELTPELLEGVVIPVAVQQVLRKAMAVDRAERHDGVLRLAEALEEALAGPPSDERTSVTASLPTPLADADGKVSTDEIERPRAEPTIIAAPTPAQLKASEPTQIVVAAPPEVDTTPPGPIPRAMIEDVPPDDDPSTLTIPRPTLPSSETTHPVVKAPPIVATHSMVGLEPVEDAPPEPGFTDETPAIPMQPVTPASAVARVSSVQMTGVPASPRPSSPEPAPDITAPIPAFVRPPMTPAQALPAIVRKPSSLPRAITSSQLPQVQAHLCPGCGSPFASQQALQTHQSSCPSLRPAVEAAPPMLMGTAMEPRTRSPQPEISARHSTAETRCRHCGMFFNTMPELETHLPRCSMKRTSFSTMGDDEPLELARPDPLLMELDDVGKSLRALQNRALADMAGRGVEMLRDMLGVLVDSRVDDTLGSAIRGRLVETARRLAVLAQDGTPLGVRQMNAQLDLMVRMTIKLQGSPNAAVLDSATRAVLEQGPVNAVKRAR